MILFDNKKKILTDRIASKEWISGKSCRTTAYRIMINDLTLCLDTTSSHTWIYTF